jgi:hypothetical protein
LERLDELMIQRDRIVKTIDGKTEIAREFAGFKKFNKNSTLYTFIIRKFYEFYKSIETVAEETEKIISLFLEGRTIKYFDNGIFNIIRFSSLELHRKLFIQNVYDDPWIQVILIASK